LNPWSILSLDDDVFRVSGLHQLSGGQHEQWTKKLQAAGKRGNVGGVLLILDGDSKEFEGHPFCAALAAATLAERSRSVGGGATFSVACVFARQEYESWLIAGIESLAGKPIGPSGPSINLQISVPDDPEIAPRDAKGWLTQNMSGVYKPTQHQKYLTELVDLDAIKNNTKMRSFRRLRSALNQLVDAIRSGQHMTSPSRPSP